MPRTNRNASTTAYRNQKAKGLRAARALYKAARNGYFNAPLHKAHTYLPAYCQAREILTALRNP